MKRIILITLFIIAVGMTWGAHVPDIKDHLDDAMKVVSVVWIDPEFTAGWRDKDSFQDDSAEQAAACQSFGLLAFENETHIVVLQSVNEHQTQNTIKIPKSCIVSTKSLADVDITI